MRLLEFSPILGQELVIGGLTYSFVGHPTAGNMVYGAEGAKGTVYKLATQSDGAFGLKVFHPLFRTSQINEDVEFLAAFTEVPGLRIASRHVITQEEAAANKQPALERSVIMPWIDGTTCFDAFLRAARNTNKDWRLAESIRLCQSFLSLVAGLETRGLTHSDLSPANIIFNLSSFEVQVLDLEDLFHESRTPLISADKIKGSPGYSHPSEESTWCREGDRYSSAILAAELLMFCDPTMARQYSDVGFFRRYEDSKGSNERFIDACNWLRGCFPLFGGKFEQAWKSHRIANCAPALDLVQALEADISKRKRVSWGVVRAFAIDSTAVTRRSVDLPLSVEVGLSEVDVEVTKRDAEMEVVSAPPGRRRGSKRQMVPVLISFVLLALLLGAVYFFLRGSIPSAKLVLVEYVSMESSAPRTMQSCGLVNSGPVVEANLPQFPALFNNTIQHTVEVRRKGRRSV